MNIFKKLFLIRFCLALLLIPLIPASAQQRTANNIPIEQVHHIDASKLTVAKELTNWTKQTLKERKTLVAIVARKGGPDVKKHDWTGMAHSGLLVYDPRAQSWLVYNLLNTQKGAMPKAAIYRSGLIDFFYGQTGYEENALILIPDNPTQERIYEAILSGKNDQLFFTDNYNLLSRYDSPRSLNCNKWLLMNITAARIDNYEVEAVLEAMNQGFEPGLIRLNKIEKHFAKKKNNVIGSEIPRKGAVQTITIASLYESGLFEETLFRADFMND